MIIKQKIILFITIVLLNVPILYSQVNSELLKENNIIFVKGKYVEKELNNLVTRTLKLDNGDYKEIFPIENGYINGRWYIIKKKKIIAEGFFKNGSGVFYEYYEYKRKILAKIHYKGNLKEGEEKRFYKNGSPMLIVNYKKGEYNGKQIFYNENGFISHISNWENNLLNGISKDFDENGNIVSYAVFFKGSGIKIKYFNDNRSIRKIITYKNNKIDGISISWFKNGKMESEVKYKKGLIDSSMKYWNEKGELIRYEIYKNGKFIKKIR